MSRLFLFMLANLAFILGASVNARAGDNRVTIAVANFDCNTTLAELRPWGKGIADMLVSDLSVSSDLRIVERERLQEILKELKLQRTTFIDKSTALRMGKGLSAEFIVTGSYSVSGQILRIDARVLDVESRQVVHTETQSGQIDDFFEVQHRLAQKLLTALGAKLSIIQKKRLGRNNTKSRSAFTAYSSALDKRDRGDKRGERKLLAKALSLDPIFSAVVGRLERLEGKVAILEKSGGLIIKPSTARHFLHNAQIHRSAGDYQSALRTLKTAIEKFPTRIDFWLLLQEITPRGTTVDLRQFSLSVPLKRAAVALLNEDLEALHAMLWKQQTKEGIYAAAFLFSLSEKHLPAKGNLRFAMAYNSAIALLAAHKKGRLAPLFVNHQQLLKRIQSVQARYFDDERVSQITTPALASIKDFSTRGLTNPWWRIRFVNYERPTGDVEIVIERDTSHPHWREKTIPQGEHYFNLYAVEHNYSKSNFLSEYHSPEAIVHDFQPWDWTKRSPLPSISKIGQPISIPAKQITCVDKKNSLTQSMCHTTFFVHKAGLPPGFYRISMKFKDADGHQVTHSYSTWAMEFNLIAIHSNTTKGTIRKVYNQQAARLHDKLLGRKFEVDGTLLVQNYFRGNKTQQLAHYYYDIDYAHNSGVSPEKTASWVKYRDQIIKRGYKVVANGNGLQSIALPKFRPGKHSLCMVAVRKNGSKSAEAECFVFTLLAP